MAIAYLIVKPGTNLLEQVVSIGDKARATIGFLPHEAFADYALRGHIIAAVEDEKVLGYVLFGKKNHLINIIQLCIDEAFRNRGIAKSLLEELIRFYEPTISGISLFCRRDFGYDKLWRKLGFSPIDEKPGRATTKETILTRWFRKNPNCLDFFSQIQDLSKRKKVVLDTNIVIALSSEKDEETTCLMNPLIINSVDFYVTKEVFSEINKKEEGELRNKHRNYVREYFDSIEKYSEITYQKVFADLMKWRNIEKETNSEMDASHIAYCVAAGCYAFITKDEAWLKENVVDYIYKEYGLIVESPGQLIRSIDELLYSNDYIPIRLSGLDYQYSLMSSKDYENVVDGFYYIYKDRRRSTFNHDLRKWMALPDKYYIELAKDGQNPLALIVSVIEDNIQKIFLFLVNENAITESIYRAFVIRLAFHMLEEARKKGLTKIMLAKDGMSSGCISPLLECGYYEEKEWLIRNILDQVINWIDIERKIPEDIMSSFKQDKWRVNISIEIEKLFWPCKIIGADIPCYIVPIRAEYAMELFDERLKNMNMSLFPNRKVIPALSNENVYFKGKFKSISKFPARILWYVSNDNRFVETGVIRASSYLDFVENDSVKELYRRNRQIGILEWRQMLTFGKPEEIISAYRFSYTEQFLRPVSLNFVRQILGRSNETFQSYLEIEESQYINIYRQGFNYE